jgi:hypothetical protein
VLLGDVVDQLQDDNGLADASAAERAHLASLEEGADQVDHLDARLQDFARGRLLDEGRGRAVDRVALLVVHRALLVHRVARDVEDAPQHAVAHRHRDGRARVDDVHAPHQALGGRHGHGAHDALAQCCCTSSTSFVGLPLTS